MHTLLAMWTPSTHILVSSTIICSKEPEPLGEISGYRAETINTEDDPGASTSRAKKEEALKKHTHAHTHIEGGISKGQFKEHLVAKARTT